MLSQADVSATNNLRISEAPHMRFWDQRSRQPGIGATGGAHLGGVLWQRRVSGARLLSEKQTL